MNKLGFIITSVLVALGIVSATLFVVDQRQFGVVFQLGQIKKVVTEPGLNWKIPLVQNVSYIDKRLLTLESTDTEPTLTAEKQRVVIDWYVRWRISEPQQYIRNVGVNERAGALQLNRVVRNSFQQEVNKRTVNELLSTRREELMEDVKRQVLAAVRGVEKPWGMDVVDVRITRVDYVADITKSVYDRMEAERKRVANELRSTGFAEGEKIRADADRQREVIVANAVRDAQKVKGDGDGKAAAIYAQAFGRDPAFAQFYRSLEAYKSSFSSKSDVLVIDPSSDFFKAMRSSNVAK
ncbi:protease modulator HflC [Hydrogenophaga sp.]|uniref:protease modulator HflC n=1 Tax=Hydrogenophaga sp. TaxID=1904254 RepID=UPI003561E185